MKIFMRSPEVSLYDIEAFRKAMYAALAEYRAAKKDVIDDMSRCHYGRAGSQAKRARFNLAMDVWIGLPRYFYGTG